MRLAMPAAAVPYGASRATLTLAVRPATRTHCTPATGALGAHPRARSLPLAAVHGWRVGVLPPGAAHGAGLGAAQEQVGRARAGRQAGWLAGGWEGCLVGWLVGWFACGVGWSLQWVCRRACCVGQHAGLGMATWAWCAEGEGTFAAPATAFSEQGPLYCTSRCCCRSPYIEYYSRLQVR